MTRALIITITAIITLGVLLADSVSAHPAWGIVVDRNNQIYISDIETVWKIDAQGKLTVFRAGVSGRHTHEINLDENGNLYGVDNAYESATQRSIAALWKITPAGEFSYVLAPTYNPPKAMTNWKDRAGNSYYVGQSENAEREIFVLKRTPDGRVTTLAGNRKAGDEYRQVVLFSVGGMAFGTDDTLYFTDNSNVRKVTMDGRMTMLARNLAVENPAESPMPESPVTRLFGIAVDAQGNAFVADYGNRRVLKVTSGGTVSTVARAERPWSPTGVALRDGNLYILEFGFTPPSKYTPRVRRLSSDGKITMLATVGENGNPSVGESSSGGSSERSAESKPSVPYILLGVGVSIFALTIVIWRVRRRIFSHQH
jgi:sugar lactone lactonase YvrE